MLSQLYIENIAVIEKASLDISAGLSVMTGETGAGKSIVIDAIHAVLGERTSREIIRTGAQSAFVSALFTDVSPVVCEALLEFGYSPDEDGALLLQREISADGKGSCRINGRPATVSVLKTVGSKLINIHGQHESYELLSPDLHVTYLDAFGNLKELILEYKAAFDDMNRIHRELTSFHTDESEKARRMDLLNYQIQELEDAGLIAGEEDELNQLKTLYVNSEKIAFSLNSAHDALNGNEDMTGAVQAVSACADALADAARFFPAVQELSGRVQSIAYDLEDCSSELRDALSQTDYDPADLERVEERLDTLYRLSRKYGSTTEEMLAYLENAKQELKSIELSDETIERLNTEYAKAKKKAEQLAANLSEKRKKTAKEFIARVQNELKFLDMPGVSFAVEQEQCPLNTLGCDKIQFLISTNPGEPPKPIAKIASGGELSRIMLAIKNVLADNDVIDTLIFDEVDTGISGSAAQKVGLKLREVSRNRQVICVTHLAQIAALAQSHLFISKHVQKGRTFTEITLLDFEGRKRELARIMGGETITPLMLESAEEMLTQAGIKS